MDLDRQREDLEQQQAQADAVASAQTAVIKLLWSGVWVPVEVDVVLLRRAVWSPDHNLFPAGIFHSFTPNQPTNPNMEDEAHKDNDETMSAQEDE
ncbi:hypothetical protein PHMEG_0001464 [Phytophthora megakarya]|uniref:Uncharacterized protein n=1 Tax=Phytophthora megakarya TaxID=4795 RepID=A0A225X1Q8_9STRA|nr:hypothetical protein PHMEG_0001464 [Phytophthora megakarya]